MVWVTVMVAMVLLVQGNLPEPAVQDQEAQESKMTMLARRSQVNYLKLFSLVVRPAARQLSNPLRGEMSWDSLFRQIVIIPPDLGIQSLAVRYRPL